MRPLEFLRAGQVILEGHEWLTTMFPPKVEDVREYGGTFELNIPTRFDAVRRVFFTKYADYVFEQLPDQGLTETKADGRVAQLRQRLDLACTKLPPAEFECLVTMR